MERRDVRVLNSINDYIKKKKKEYTEEAQSAKDHQDNAKRFAQSYMSPEFQLSLKIKELEKDIKQSTSGGQNSESGASSGSPGVFSGTIQEKFWQFFVADGYTKEAVAGMMGNVQQESSFDPAVVESNPNSVDARGGYGLIQWTGGRRVRLEEAAKKQKRPVNDIQFQLEHMKMELDEGHNWMSIVEGDNEKYTFDKFRKTNDIEFAMHAFCWMFERPERGPKANVPLRLEFAHKYYKEFKDFKGSSIVSGDFALPTNANCDITSGYGMRVHPVNGGMHMHRGVDYSSGGGLDLYSIADGSVTIARFDAGSGYGNLVKIKHGDNLSSLYAHLAHIDVSGGQKVKKGQRIGTMGTTGMSTGVHLHFEMLENDKNVNPEKYFPTYKRTAFAEQERKQGVDSVI